MKNLYSPSKILTKEEFKKIEKAFEKAWGKDTTYPDILKDWNMNEKSYGQCLITTLVISDLFGGQMVYDKVNRHFWNILPDGSEQDFSRTQFQDETFFNITSYKTRDEMLFDENGIKKESEKRYILLKQRFRKFYNG